VVTTNDMGETVCRRHPGLAKRVILVLNYVDTVSFAPAGNWGHRSRVFYIVRFSGQKNLDVLIDAVRIGRWSLTLVGSGDEGQRLRRCSADLGARVEFRPRLTHAGVPRLMAREAAVV